MKKDFTVYTLYIDSCPYVLCHDKWLVELYLVQRKLHKRNYEIRKEIERSMDCVEYNIYLVYYYGYAITQDEMRFIDSTMLEYDSGRKGKIFDLKCFLDKFKNKLTKSEIKAIKKTIKVLKKYKSDSDEMVHSNLDTILNDPNCVNEYLMNLDLFRQEMEGEI